jgi:hypothetical protein
MLNISAYTIWKIKLKYIQEGSELQHRISEWSEVLCYGLESIIG